MYVCVCVGRWVWLELCTAIDTTTANVNIDTSAQRLAVGSDSCTFYLPSMSISLKIAKHMFFLKYVVLAQESKHIVVLDQCTKSLPRTSERRDAFLTTCLVLSYTRLVLGERSPLGRAAALLARCPPPTTSNLDLLCGADRHPSSSSALGLYLGPRLVNVVSKKKTPPTKHIEQLKWSWVILINRPLLQLQQRGG
jgi:hypothetical protein